MSPASYQTAPPRVVWIADLGLWIADWSKSQRRSPSRWPLTQSAFRNPQSALARAGNGTRTRDPNLGKVVLYQLSYSRVRTGTQVAQSNLNRGPCAPQGRLWRLRVCASSPYGGEGDRTPDLVNAIHALSQLSYAPVIFAAPSGGPSGGNTTSYRDVPEVSSDKSR